MNAAIELHDSVLGAVVREGNDVVVRLAPAYVHRSSGRPGWDDGIGGWQNCALVVEGGSIEGEVGDLPADVMNGDLRIGETDHPNMITLPWEVVGEVATLMLHLDPDYRRIVVSGTGLHVREEGTFEHAEEFRASS